MGSGLIKRKTSGWAVLSGQPDFQLAGYPDPDIFATNIILTYQIENANIIYIITIVNVLITITSVLMKKWPD